MLSNTATPKYYGMFRKAVLDGKIPVSETVSMQMNLIDRLIADPRYYYDDEAVEGYISFCEDELTLTDGSPMFLLDTFKLWAEDLLGWFFFQNVSVYRPDKDGHGGHYVKKTVKRRLRNKQMLIVARGAAKSVYDSTIQFYGLVIDQDTTHQIAVAPVMKLAEETLSPIRTALVRSRGPLLRFLTSGSLQNTTGKRENRKKLASTKVGIQNFLNGSFLEVRPMTIPKVQGLQVKYSTIDEWLSCPIREDVIGAVEQGASKLDDYIIVCTSSEGTVRQGPGDDIKMELMSILKGEYVAPNVSIWWYRLDDVKEVSHPELWPKAQPNLGQTVKWEIYHQELERMEKVPSYRNDCLAKRFGIPMEGFTYFFSYEETKRHKPRCFWNCPCSMGVDLSQGDDFCAFTFLFPIMYGQYGVKVRAYISERTMKLLPGSMKEKYEEFMKEGTLMVMPGSTLDMMEVFDDLDAFILNCNYDVRCVGYDPYGAKEFIERWIMLHGDFAVVKVPQGVKTETIPLGELKDLSEDGLLLFDELLMSWSMGNCVVIEDTNGNRKLLKKRREEKIDNVSALMDAYVAFKATRNLVF